MSVLKAGLEIEVEPGVMKQHKNLVFVKIHAPTDVLEEYIEVVDVKKYFKQSHAEWIKPVNSFINQYLCFFTRVKHEREWIDIVRKQYSPPSYYSTYERSLTVYKILLQLPFGPHVNQFGLGRLLQKNIILDAYALHDGPYFYTRKQDFNKVNARQILFDNWVGMFNLLKMQPLNLIHEYLGSKVAFYFAFFQFYIPFLLIPALIGTGTMIFAMQDKAYKQVEKDLCDNKNDSVACPLCYNFKICGFRHYDNFCLRSQFVNIFDHRGIIGYCAVMIIWSGLFVVLWKRKERYWVWFWELSHVEKLQSMRPQFKIDYNKSNRSPRTGIWKNYNSGIPLLISVAFGIAMTFFMALGAVLYSVYIIVFKFTKIMPNRGMYFFKYKGQVVLKQEYGRYAVLSTVALLNVLGLSVFEKICKKLTYLVTNFENHRAEESYERSVIVKQTVVAFACTFPIFAYFAYFKVMFYRTPGHNDARYFYINCGPLNCMDELGVVFVVTLFMKQIIPKLIECFIGCLYRKRTDYNQGLKVTRTIPCWEREYRLKPLTEYVILQRYLYLARQFGFILLFAPAFPLTAALAFVVNIFHIRYDAEVFLLNSRRPLLVDTAGIGIWNAIFNFIPYMATITNALILGFSSRITKRFVHLSNNKDMKHYLSSTMTKFDTQYYYPRVKTYIRQWFMEYRKKGYVPNECFFPGYMYDTSTYQRKFFNLGSQPKEWGGEIHDDECILFEPIVVQVWRVGHDWDYVLKKRYIGFCAHATKFEVEFKQCILLLLFMNGVFFVLLMFRYLIRTRPVDIEESITIEENLKKHYVLERTLK